MQQIQRGMPLVVAVLLTACGGGGGGGAADAPSTGSQSVAVDVSLSATAPAVVTVGQPISYSVTVVNPAANAADNTVATISFSGGVSVSAARTASGTCIVTSVVSCSLGSMPPGTNIIEIDATATAASDAAISASVTSATFDPNTANNGHTKTTAIGISTAVLQQAIDRAVAGQTIVVDPGTYVGSLTFRGKDIKLISRDGPTTTRIIQAVGLGAVQMGPGGTVEAFTIVPRTVGVQVNGSGGSVISGNVFDAGPWGAPLEIGVGGVNASGGATVQNNVFRNHSCLSPFTGELGSIAVVTFSSLANATSYGAVRVMDNLFENNNCADIALQMLPPTADVTIDRNTSLNNTMPVPTAPIIPSSATLAGSVGGSIATVAGFEGGAISWGVINGPVTMSTASGNVTLNSVAPNTSGSILLTTSPSSFGSNVLTAQ